MGRMLFLIIWSLFTISFAEENSSEIDCTYIQDGKIEKIIRLPGSDLERNILLEYGLSGKLVSKIWPNGISLYYRYDEKGYLSSIASSDGTIDYRLICSKEGDVLECLDLNTNQGIIREIDSQRNLVKEVFPSGEIISYLYGVSKELKEVRYSTLGTIEYEYENKCLSKVNRYSLGGELLYSHDYIYSSIDRNLVQENLIGELGSIKYEINKREGVFLALSPFLNYQLQLNKDRQLSAVYLSDNQTSSNYEHIDKDLFGREVDEFGNPKNAKVNQLHELLSYKDIECEYDPNGNLVIKRTPDNTYELFYDALNRLIKIKSQTTDLSFTYDFFGRRLSKSGHFEGNKIEERYIYQKDQEVAVLNEDRELIAFRTLGLEVGENLTRSIGFETKKGIYAPIYDHACHVRKLVNIQTGQIYDYMRLDPFAENLAGLYPIVPWIYSAKHFDPEINLIYFGHRYYDPSVKRWITIDPLGPVDSLNLYLFAKNNPLKYYDPDGCFAFVIAAPLIGFSIKAMLTATAWASAGALTAWSTYKINKAIKEKNEAERVKKWEEAHKSKSGSVDPSLPKNPDDLLKRPGWKETTHPNAGKKGHRTFENKETGEKLRHDEGKPYESGHEKYNHYHRPNPNKTSKHDEYLDHNHNPVGRHSDTSHIYPPENVWWNK